MNIFKRVHLCGYMSKVLTYVDMYNQTCLPSWMDILKCVNLCGYMYSQKCSLTWICILKSVTYVDCRRSWGIDLFQVLPSSRQSNYGYRSPKFVPGTVAGQRGCRGTSLDSHRCCRGSHYTKNGTRVGEIICWNTCTFVRKFLFLIEDTCSCSRFRFLI